MTIKENKSVPNGQDTQHLSFAGKAGTWSYPMDFKDDFRNIGVSDEFVAETLACTYEFTRCVIPHYTNWRRYVAYVRLIGIAVVGEYSGGLMDVAESTTLLGYDIDELLSELLGGTPAAADMILEYKSSVLFTADKSSKRRNSDLFRRYVDALAWSPKQWFRLRDCDGLARFSIAAALACNDIYDVWFTSGQLEILGEISLWMYDSVAYYKHRAEGETHNTFAYAGCEVREEGYRRAREVLWALDAATAQDLPLQITINFVRFYGGPIQMMMRRYRFVEDGLNMKVAGSIEEQVEDEARRHIKLWNRVDQTGAPVQDDRYETILAKGKGLLIPELVEALSRDGEDHCSQCRYRDVYGAEISGQFGGVELCEVCKSKWRSYLRTLPVRAAVAFPIHFGAVSAPPNNTNHYCA